MQKEEETNESCFLEASKRKNQSNQKKQFTGIYDCMLCAKTTKKCLRLTKNPRNTDAK